MAKTDHLRPALEHYRKLRQDKIDSIAPVLEEIKELDRMIGKLAADLGEPANIEPLNLISSADSASAVDASRKLSAGAKPVIAPDEFFGMSQRDAAKAYLKMVGRAITLDELVSALQAGGAKVGGVNPKRTLYVSLYNKKEFVWPSSDHIGLAEFYPGRK